MGEQWRGNPRSLRNRQWVSHCLCVYLLRLKCVCIFLWSLFLGNFQPQSIVKSLVPSWNTLVLFEVSPVSFHQVKRSTLIYNWTKKGKVGLKYRFCMISFLAGSRGFVSRQVSSFSKRLVSWIFFGATSSIQRAIPSQDASPTERCLCSLFALFWLRFYYFLKSHHSDNILTYFN